MTNSSFSSDRLLGGVAKNTGAGAAACGGGGGRAPSPSVEDAIGYVQMVKDAFKDREPDKYRLFLRIMNDFKNQRMGIAEVASSARALFRDAPELALGFNVFLPKEHKIQQIGLGELAACFVRDMSLDDDDDQDDKDN